jgi:Protein of unknown function (DUF2865)
MRRRWQIAAGAALLVGVAGLSVPAQAGDFFSNLFGGFGARPQAPRPQMVLPFGDDGTQPMEAPRPRTAYGGGQAWCVRSCDGRYFPIAGPDAQSKAASCNSFCPASQTEIVYGNDIDHAATSNGKPYPHRQGPGRARAGLDRQGSDLAQGRHRRWRRRACDRQPRLGQARRSEFHAGAGVDSFALSTRTDRREGVTLRRRPGRQLSLSLRLHQQKGRRCCRRPLLSEAVRAYAARILPRKSVT